MDLQNARDQLFAASPERFVALRTELATELAREGHKEDSRTLKAIRRPSTSAWATNQVVRQSLDEASAFFEASDRLRQAQHAMLAQQSQRAAYQAAADEFREATTVLGSAIKETLASVGRNADPPLIERVLSNFRNAALSEDRRAALLGGQLEVDIESGEDDLASLFGSMPGAGAPTSHTNVAAPVPPGSSASASQSIGRAERLEQARREREEQARAQEAELQRRVQAARDEEAAAAQKATEAETKVVEARASHDQAREQLDEADRAATLARQVWRERETTLHRAERAATEARAAVDSAVRRRADAERKTR